jgi:uncharacterized iron-regulated protein
MRRLALVLTVLLTLACATPGRIQLAPWQAPLEREHPLTGRIWEVRAARFVTADEVARRLVTAHWILLGEKHDNPDHHQIQAALLRSVLASGRSPAVAFEMLTADEAPAVARQLAAVPRDAEGLAGVWKRSGWPDFKHYRPIVQAALDAGVPIVAANLPNATIRAVARGDAAAVPSELAARYLNRPLPPAVQTQLTNEIRDAHCGHLPPSMVTSMVLAQQARDAKLADSLIVADHDHSPPAAGAPQKPGDGGVLIAGIGHVRADHGVPIYLERGSSRGPTVTVAPLEVRAERTTPEAYATDFEGTLPFDFVWFTPRMDYDDPCARFPGPRA